MKKTIVLGMAALALVTTACGSSASYKALKGNPPADPTAEQKALSLLESDGGAVSAKSNRNTMLSQQMIQEIQGLSLKFSQAHYMHAGVQGNVIRDEKLAEVEISKISANNACALDAIKSQNFKTSEDLSQKYVTFTNEGRFRCLEAACENILLILDTTRSISIVNEAGRAVSERQSATLPVLLAKDAADGVFKPVQTESDIFLQVLDKDSAQAACLESQEASQSPEESGNQATTTDSQTTSNSFEEARMKAQLKRQMEADARWEAQMQASTNNTVDNTVENTTSFANDPRMRAQMKRQMEADARQEAQLRARSNNTSTIQVITPVAAP